MLALGTDWDEAAEKFREDRSCAKFDDLILFEESETQRRTFSVTLHPVIEGKAKPTLLSEAEATKRTKRKGTVIFVQTPENVIEVAAEQYRLVSDKVWAEANGSPISRPLARGAPPMAV